MRAAQELKEAGFRLTRVEDDDAMLDFVRHGAQDAVILTTALKRAEADVFAVRRARARLPVMVLDDAGDRTRWGPLYAAGADAVLPAPVDGDELAARLRAMVMRVSGYATPRPSFGALTLDTVCRCARVGTNVVPLSPHEYELLEIIVLAAGRAIGREEAMDRLYAWEAEPGARILDVFATRLRTKLLEAGLNPKIVQSLRGVGWRLEPGAAERRSAGRAGPDRDGAGRPAA